MAIALPVWFVACAGGPDVSSDWKESGPNDPSDWKEIGRRGAFTCMIPPYLEKTPKQGIDSYVESHEGRGMAVSFDYGPFSARRPSTKTWVKKSTETIGGETATVFRQYLPDRPRGFERAVQVHFEDVGDGKGGTRLFLSVWFKNEQDSETALMIIRSIRFR